MCGGKVCMTLTPWIRMQPCPQSLGRFSSQLCVVPGFQYTFTLRWHVCSTGPSLQACSVVCTWKLRTWPVMGDFMSSWLTRNTDLTQKSSQLFVFKEKSFASLEEISKVFQGNSPKKILSLDWALLWWRQKLGKAMYPHAVLRPMVASEPCTPGLEVRTAGEISQGSFISPWFPSHQHHLL